MVAFPTLLLQRKLGMEIIIAPLGAEVLGSKYLSIHGCLYLPVVQEHISLCGLYNMPKNNDDNQLPSASLVL